MPPKPPVIGRPGTKDTMADDEVIDEEDEFGDDLEADLDVDELDEDALEDDLVEVDLEVADEVFDADAEVDVVVVEEIPDEPPPRARKKAAAGEDEPDEDEVVVDPDDVEADLDTILKDRIAAADDEEDEEEVEAPDARGPETPDGVTPKKANEFVCPGCFLLVNRGQFGPADNMTCPVGESDCPAITQLKKAKK
jgi:hypothetical protein